MQPALKSTQADVEIRRCSDNHQSFAVVAGAGSGKTTSLVEALKHIRKNCGSDLLRDNQQVVCITYTKRAVAVISERLEFDELFHISTLHSFLWGVIRRFQKDIREALKVKLIPDLIARTSEKDNGKKSKEAVKAREKVAQLNEQLSLLDEVDNFRYGDSNTYSNFSIGQIGHDDMVDLAAYLILEKPLLARGLGLRFPYIFVDEAQDTFAGVITAFNSFCIGDGLPLVGYFGDPMQQIYDDGTGEFGEAEGLIKITKEENFRSTPEIIKLLNAFRKDVVQIPSGENTAVEGSVRLMLIQAEQPEEPRNRYSSDQLSRNLDRFDKALIQWGWENNTAAKRLFLARQMIARRLGFSDLHKIFTGTYSSAKSQADYEDGEHFLLKPFISTLSLLVEAYQKGDQRKVIEVLSRSSPSFDPLGNNGAKSLKEMLTHANSTIAELNKIWEKGVAKDILLFARDQGLCEFSPILISHLERTPRTEKYDEEVYALDKTDWLSDVFFNIPANELKQYSSFFSKSTPLSTQHGSKGEEYDDVLVVFDDKEAAWTKYNFMKLLTPATSGDAKSSQFERSQKLAYVCFSRARINLRVLLFSDDAENARDELISSGLFISDQIDIL